MESEVKGFVIQNPANGLYVQFDGSTIIFKSAEEVAEFKQTYCSFFTGTDSVPQMVPVDQAFIDAGDHINYVDIGEKLRSEAKEEVEAKYGND